MSPADEEQDEAKQDEAKREAEDIPPGMEEVPRGVRPYEPKGSPDQPSTLWGRNDDEFSLEALRFLKDYGREPKHLFDIKRRPPQPLEWARISDGLGSLVDAIDKRHEDFKRVFHDLDRLDEKTIAMRLHKHLDMVRVPVLLNEHGAVAGFGEGKWRDFLGVGKRK